MELITLGLDTSGRPLVVDDRTLATLRAAQAALGFEFTIVQGSYRAGSGAAASAGTHDGGGVIDLRTWNLPAHISPQEAVRALRLAGLIAWYRTNAQGFDPHIHAIDYGNPRLAPSAARQVAAYEAGRNGLASNGPDDGPRVTIPQNPPREDWFDMATEKEVRKIIREELAAQFDKELQRDKNVKKRDRVRYQRLRDLVKDNAEALAELDALEKE